MVSEMTNDVNLMYGQYTEELDTLTPEQVNIVKPSLIFNLYLEIPLPCCSCEKYCYVVGGVGAIWYERPFCR